MKYGTGRISEIISELRETHKVKSVFQLSAKVKLDAICEALQMTYDQVDEVIASNSPVMRTVKAHVFETVFDRILASAGCEVVEVGGDDDVDRIVNGITLQLKTPYAAGSNGSIVSYKTHKTHGAKSERESMEYYHGTQQFADYLVGLISYDPLKIIFLKRNELPTHPSDKDRILSPFSVDCQTHPGINIFNCIGVDKINLCAAEFRPTSRELLPRSSEVIQVTSEVIIDTILKESNFRIWDMAIRGFARQVAFSYLLQSHSIAQHDPVKLKKTRGDKADLALALKEKKMYKYFQVKGVSTNNCNFDGENSTVAVETQLTRGRVNDHPTQSRLYLKSDFEYLMVIIDPCQAQMYLASVGKTPRLEWQYYSIPTTELLTHPKYPNRLKSLQTLSYKAIQKYRVGESWFNQWAKTK